MLATNFRLPCGAVAPNRLVKGAMTECMASPADNAPTSELIRLYKRWGDGGIGISITGNVQVDRRWLEAPANVVLEDERHMGRFEEWAAAAKASGGLIVMQISHPGRQCPVSVSLSPLSASDVPLSMSGGTSLLFRPPRAMTGEEVEEVIQRFVTTARLAKKAGFDGVQVHAAHGYLLSQFLSPVTNKRTDQWGGTAEKRRALLLTVVRRVREAVGDEFIVAVKLNSDDFRKSQSPTESGAFTTAESMQVLRALEAEAVDFVEVSGGTYEKAEMMKEAPRASTRAREGFFIQFAEEAMREVTSLPLCVTGGFRTAEGINAALESGVSLIGIARPVCVEPDLPKQMVEGSVTSAAEYSLSFGIKYLDQVLGAGVVNFWHQKQMRRLAANQGACMSFNLYWIVLSRIGGYYVWAPTRNKKASALGVTATVIAAAALWFLRSRR